MLHSKTAPRGSCSRCATPRFGARPRVESPTRGLRVPVPFARPPPDAADAAVDPRPARGLRRGGRRLPSRAAAADPGLPDRRRRRRTARARRSSPTRRPRATSPSSAIVFLMFSHRARVQPGAAACDAPRGVRARAARRLASPRRAGALLLPCWGSRGRPGLALGGALAMSSTAIVTKMLAERDASSPRRTAATSSGSCCSRTSRSCAFLIVIPRWAGPEAS